MRTVTAEEHANIGIGPGDGQVLPEELARLLREWKRATGEEPAPYFEQGGRWVRATGWTGLLASADVVLEILPRGASALGDDGRATLDRNLGQMLELTLGGAAVPLTEAELSDAGTRYERVVDSLCEVLMTARRQRRLRSYAVRAQDSSAVRGRLRFPQQAMLASRRPGLFSSTWVELDEDVPVNRFLRGVIEIVAGRVHGRVRRRAEEALVELEAARPSNPYEEYGRIDWHRLPTAYVSAVSLAKSVLDGEIPGLYAGRLAGRSEVLLLPTLFDGFVSRLTREAAGSLGLHGVEKARGRYLSTWQTGPFAGRETVEVVPDAEVRDVTSSPLVIVDAKWKLISPGRLSYGLSAPDIHQMLAYGIRLDCPRAVLVYPDIADYGPASERVRLRAGATSAYVDVEILRLPLLWQRLSDPVGRLADAISTFLT